MAASGWEVAASGGSFRKGLAARRELVAGQCFVPLGVGVVSCGGRGICWFGCPAGVVLPSALMLWRCAAGVVAGAHRRPRA